MAALNSQVPSPSGVVAVYNAVTASDTVPNPGGRTVVLVRNDSAGAVNVTLVGRGMMADVVVPNRVISVAAAQHRLIDLNAALYNDAAGLVTIQFSATPSVTMAVIYMP